MSILAKPTPTMRKSDRLAPRHKNQGLLIAGVAVLYVAAEVTGWVFALPPAIAVVRPAAGCVLAALLIWNYWTEPLRGANEGPRRGSQGRRLLRDLLELQEEERKIMAHGIHDGMVQYMVGALMSLDSPAMNLPADQSQAIETLNVCRKLIRMSIDESRHLIGELRPLIMDESGLVESLGHLIHDQGLGGIEVRFVPTVDEDLLPPLFAGNVFRIVQEALTNIRKHSQAKHVHIKLTQNEENLQIEIEDDGIGFRLNDKARNRFGVEGMIKRAHLFGGRAMFNTSPGNGTKIHIVLPLELPQDIDVTPVTPSPMFGDQVPSGRDPNTPDSSNSSSASEFTPP